MRTGVALCPKSQLGMASITHGGAMVGTIFASLKPAASSRAANSTLARTRPPVITNMLRSRSFLKQFAATGFESATQTPPVQLIRVLVAIEVAFQTNISVINITVKEHLTNAFTLVPDRMIGLLLREPKCWIWFFDTDDSRMTHFYFFFFCNRYWARAPAVCVYALRLQKPFEEQGWTAGM